LEAEVETLKKTRDNATPKVDKTVMNLAEACTQSHRQDEQIAGSIRDGRLTRRTAVDVFGAE